MNRLNSEIELHHSWEKSTKKLHSDLVNATGIDFAEEEEDEEAWRGENFTSEFHPTRRLIACRLLRETQAESEGLQTEAGRHEREGNPSGRW